MAQTANQRHPVGVFADSQAADTAVQRLQNAGFASEQLSVVSRQMSPTSVDQTETFTGLKSGAIAGALFGALAGFLLGYMSGAGGGAPSSDFLQHLLGLALAGSAVGAAGGGLIGSLTSANVYKPGINVEYVDMAGDFLLLLEGTSDEAARAGELLKQPQPSP